MRRSGGCQPYSCLFLLALSLNPLFIKFLFVLGLIHLLMVICGSFTLKKLFEFIFTNFWLNEVCVLFFDKLVLWKKFLN